MEKKILIVDDDLEFSSLLTDVYTQANYSVRSIQDPAEAISMLRDEEVSLIISDQRMPSLSGLEFIRELKKASQSTPAIIVSGHLEDDTIRELIKEGAEGIFLKPVNILSLLKKSEELLAEREQARKAECSVGVGQDGIPGLNPASFRSFPCRSPISAQFARRLYEVRNFRSNLMLVGAEGSNFEEICRDLSRFDMGDRENLVFCHRDQLNEESLLKNLEPFDECEIGTVTLVITRTESLVPENLDAIFRLSKREPPFDSHEFTTRFVFCMQADVDTLYDGGVIDENFYIFLGSSEIEVPLLTDCKEDIPIIAQEIISEESFRSPSSFRHELDEGAKSLLGREAWQGDYRS